MDNTSMDVVGAAQRAVADLSPHYTRAVLAPPHASRRLAAKALRTALGRGGGATGGLVLMLRSPIADAWQAVIVLRRTEVGWADRYRGLGVTVLAATHAAPPALPLEAP